MEDTQFIFSLNKKNLQINKIHLLTITPHIFVSLKDFFPPRRPFKAFINALSNSLKNKNVVRRSLNLKAVLPIKERKKSLQNLFLWFINPKTVLQNKFLQIVSSFCTFSLKIVEFFITSITFFIIAFYFRGANFCK